MTLSAVGAKYKKKPAGKVATTKYKRTRKGAKQAKASSGTVVLTKRRKTFRENHSNENHTTSLQVRARMPSMMRLIQMNMEPQWWRVQGLTEYDTASGFYPIANRIDAGGQHILPMHVWDLTCTPNTQAGGFTYPNAGHVCYFGSTAANASAKTNPLNSQDATGATVGGSAWQDENSSIGGAGSVVPPGRKSLHHYSHVKMNLYGVRQRATRYVVQLVMVKQEYGDFLEAADTNVEKRKIWDYLMRPFIYNNLNSGDPQVSSDIKILKTYETWINPISTDEYGGQTATPHIQTLNWFIRHERVRVYDWKRGDNPDNGQNAGFDLEDGETTGRVDPKRRVYLLIRALSPSRRVADVTTAVDPITEPSYDIVIRNKFSNPR